MGSQIRQRKRGIILDPALVRMYAANMGISKKHQFQAAYERRFNENPDGNAPSAPAKAWEGIVMDKKYATNIGLLLGMSDFSLIEQTIDNTNWSRILKQNTPDEVLFDWYFEENKNQGRWRNVDFSLLEDNSDNDQITIGINKKWQLILFGEPGDKFAIFLQSERLISQLAPKDHKLCKSEIGKKETAIKFPQRPLLQFSKEDGLGKRKLIVIRAKEMPIASRTNDMGHFISALELEHFASRFYQINKDDYHVQIFQFSLTEDT